MAIQVGIRENIQILGAEKNDKGTLVIHMKEQLPGAVSGGGLMADLNANTDTNLDNENGMMIWPVTVNAELHTVEEKSKDVVNKLKTLRAKLTHILMLFLRQDQIQWNALSGITVTDEGDLTRAFADNEALVNKVYDNYISQFITMIAPHVGPTSPLTRWKFTRASKAKHFANIPSFAPFAELMAIPKAQSKLAFSKYELGYRKGDPDGQPSGTNLADGTPVTTESATAQAEELKAVEDLFGVPVAN
jgi:hypothetical protein